MSSSTSSSPPSSPSSPASIEGFELLTVQTVSVPPDASVKDPELDYGDISDDANPARSQSPIGRGQRITGRASVTLLRVSDIDLSNRASWMFDSPTSSSPSSLHGIMPGNSTPPQTQTGSSHEAAALRTRSMARASRPPALPLASSALEGLGDAFGSPPERLSVRAPTPPKSRRLRTLTAPPDAPEPSVASGSSKTAGAADDAPIGPEPTSADSHRSFATFGGERDAETPRTKDPPLPPPPSAPHPTPSSRARHQSLDTCQTPFPLPPRNSSISYSGVSKPRQVLVPARTSSLSTTESGGSTGVSAADKTPQASSHAQASARPQTESLSKSRHYRNDGGTPAASHWADRRAHGHIISEHAEWSRSSAELMRVNDNLLGTRLEPADEHESLTESASVDHDMMSESGFSNAPLLPRASGESHVRASISSEHSHTRPILLPNPQDVVRIPPMQSRSGPRVRISQTVGTHGSLSSSTLQQQQKALLIRRNRKLGQVLGVSLPESDVGQFVVEPSVASTTVLTKVETAWPEHQGPEWERDDCVPRIAEKGDSDGEDADDRTPKRTKSKLKRSIEVVKMPENLQVYVSCETSVTETTAPESQRHPLEMDSTTSSPPPTPLQTREEAIRARRRAQLAKLQRILGSPINPRLVLAPEDDVPTCGPVRSPSETSLSSPRRPAFRERVKSFVIPSPIFTMSETERRLARKRASKLEHLFGDAPPKEMIFPGRLDPTHSQPLEGIREGEGGTMGVPGLAAEENKMFISMSPAATAYHSPEETFEEYKHSLLGLMHLIEHDQVRLAAIIDQLEPQLYNFSIQSSLALQMPRQAKGGNVIVRPAPQGLARRSSAPPLPNFSRMNGGAPGPSGQHIGGHRGVPGARGAHSAHGPPSRAVVHPHAHPRGHGQGHAPRPSITEKRIVEEPRPSLQTPRSGTVDPFSEYLRSQAVEGRRENSAPHTREASSATNSTVRAGPASSSGHGSGSAGQTPKQSGPYASGSGLSPRKLSGFFGKPKTPTIRHNPAGPHVPGPPAPATNPPAPSHTRQRTGTITEQDTTPPGTTSKKRGRKFSKLFSSSKRTTAEPQPPMVLRPNPFYIRRQTLDGVLAELRRSFLLDLDNGRLRPADAHTLHDMLELLNHMRAGTPWAELEDSEW